MAGSALGCGVDRKDDQANQEQNNIGEPGTQYGLDKTFMGKVGPDGIEKKRGEKKQKAAGKCGRFSVSTR